MKCIMCDTYISDYVTDDCKAYCNKYNVEIENIFNECIGEYKEVKE